MKYSRIHSPDEKAYYNIGEVEDAEFVNPYKFHENSMIPLLKEMRIMALGPKIAQFSHLPTKFLDFMIWQHAKEEFDGWISKVKENTIPDGFLQLLKADKKKDQKKCLKNVEIGTWEFLKFVLLAFDEYGYKFSQYTSEHLRKGLTKEEMPLLVNNEKDKLVKVGETDLTDGQLREAIETRRRTIAKFLDKGEEWHCFFSTMNSINGEENYKGDQAHMHYISSKWGLERSYVVDQLKQKRYKLPSIHVHYSRERDKSIT